MGWTHSHLHQFLVQDGENITSYGEPSPEDNFFHKDEQNVYLAQIAPKVGGTFIYEYDFGDSWKHEVLVEGIELTPQNEPPYPACIDGSRACPNSRLWRGKWIRSVPRSLAQFP